MGGFLFRLETVEGEPAEPPTLSAGFSNWKPGDCIYFGHRTLRVVGRRDDEADQPARADRGGRGVALAALGVTTGGREPPRAGLWLLPAFPKISPQGPPTVAHLSCAGR